MLRKVHLIRVAACLSAAVVAGFLASALSVRMTAAPPPPDLTAMDSSLELATQLVLNRAELTLRTVDLQSLLIQEATSGQCSSGARFLLRQAMIENAVVRYAALMREGRLSCQPGQEEESVLGEAVADRPVDADILLIGPDRSGRAGEAALVRFKEDGFASVFWFPVDRLVADPLKTGAAPRLSIRLSTASNEPLAQVGDMLPSGSALKEHRAVSDSYPIIAALSAPDVVVSQVPPPSPLWPIGSALAAAFFTLIWGRRSASSTPRTEI